MEQLSYRSVRVGKTQSGVALVVVLIMLAAMAISGVALVRVVDSANVISGNFSFRQSTLNIADLGVEAAAAELVTILDSSSEKPYPPNCTTNCRYFPARSVGTMVDAKGLPTQGNVDGSTTRTRSIAWSGNDVNDPPDPQRAPEKAERLAYDIRYVIDRQCKVAPVTDPVDQCINSTPGGGSKKSGTTALAARSEIYYRVSIQVTGPRKTQSFVQVMLRY
jgi:type IV pilus assembly protein PilX